MSHFLFLIVALIFITFGFCYNFHLWRKHGTRNKMLRIAAYGSKKQMFDVSERMGISLLFTTPIPVGLWPKYGPYCFGAFICSLLKTTPLSNQAPDVYENVARCLLENKNRRSQKKFLAGMKSRRHKDVLANFKTALASENASLRQQRAEARRQKIITRGLASS